MPRLPRRHIGLVAPHRFNRRQGLCQARVLNKQRAQVLEHVASVSDSSEDERPTTSGSGIDASRALFDQSHIAAWTPQLALYAPLGAVLGAFRSLLWILGIYLDQPWFRNQSVVDAYLRLLGVTVVWNHPERIPAGRHLMVSNHCSVGDLMMLFSHPALPQRYTHLITSALPARVTQSRNLPVVLRPASPAVYDELAASSDPGPVHLFPEGGMTNGRGMLRFSRGFTRIMQRPQQQQQQPEPQALPEAPLAHQHQQHQPTVAKLHLTDRPSGHHAQAQPTLTHGSAASVYGSSSSSSSEDSEMAAGMTLPVVPVALRVRTTLPGVSSHTLTSPFLSNLFWFSFSPATTLEATVLPAMVPAPGEARGAFVNRVQAAIAAELGVEVYDMTIQQKRALLKAAQAEAKR